MRRPGSGLQLIEKRQFGIDPLPAGVPRRKQEGSCHEARRHKIAVHRKDWRVPRVSMRGRIKDSTPCRLSCLRVTSSAIGILLVIDLCPDKSEQDTRLHETRGGRLNRIKSGCSFASRELKRQNGPARATPQTCRIERNQRPPCMRLSGGKWLNTVWFL